MSRNLLSRLLLTLVICLSVVLQSCHINDANSSESTPKYENTITYESPVIVSQVNDLTQSAQPISYFDSCAARQLCASLAATSGVIKYIEITDNSNLQDVVTLNIPKVDTVNTNSIANVYKRGKARTQNQQIVTAYKVQVEREIAQYIQCISKPRDKQYTTLNQALSLAVGSLQSPNFSNYTKYLLISSDLINDPPSGDKKVQSFVLSNTVVLAIRPAISLDSIQAIFPGAPVYVFTSATDAVSFISHNKNQ